MATETETGVRTDAETSPWRSAVIAGLIAGIVMGFMIQFVMGIMPVIGALYGFQNLVAGWIAHLFHSVVFGLLYAGVVNRVARRSPATSQRGGKAATHTALAGYASRTGSGAVLGAAYGVVVWVVAAGVVMPIWLSAIGLPSPGVPNLDPMSLVGHLVYGVLLGAAYAALLNR